MGHARLSPSSSKRWMSCPGSVRLIEALPAEESNQGGFYQAEGTVAHAICENMLRGDRSVKVGNYEVCDNIRIPITDEMMDACEVYSDYINSRCSGADVGIEVPCSLSHLGVDGLDGGTSDCVLVHTKERTIEVIDYKHGRGVSVEPENNTQAMQYALGALHNELHITTIDIISGRWLDEVNDWDIIITIVQPRAYHPNGPVRSWEISGSDLNLWARDVLIPSAHLCNQDDAPLSASEDACRWCPVRDCKAKYDAVTDAAMIEFEGLGEDEEVVSVPEVKNMTDEEIIRVMEHSEIIKSLLDDVKTHVSDSLKRGEDRFKDKYKLVASRTSRKLQDAAFDPIFSPLLDYVDEGDLYEKVPKGIGKIEKLISNKLKKENIKNPSKEAKRIVDEVCKNGDTSEKLVKSSDPREGLVCELLTCFENLSDSEK